jgi:hypothetical protein
MYLKYFEARSLTGTGFFLYAQIQKTKFEAACFIRIAFISFSLPGVAMVLLNVIFYDAEISPAFGLGGNINCSPRFLYRH